MKNNGGFSLIETLIVVLIFGVLGIITTQIITLSVRSAGKSESTVKVREDLNHVVGVIERELRNASSVACPDSHTVNYLNAANSWVSFSCIGSANSMYVASVSAQITGTDTNITTCNFTCPTDSSVTIELQANNAAKSGVESAVVDISTQINLRNQ